VLFKEKLHPETLVSALNNRQLKTLVDAVRSYSFDFYRWKKIYQLRKHWLVYSKKVCPQCNFPLIKKNTGKRNRRSSFCNNCQILLKRKSKQSN